MERSKTDTKQHESQTMSDNLSTGKIVKTNIIPVIFINIADLQLKLTYKRNHAFC